MSTDIQSGGQGSTATRGQFEPLFPVTTINSWSVPGDPHLWAPLLDRVQLANAHGSLVRWYARLFPDLSFSGDADSAPREFMQQIAKCLCYLAQRRVPIALKPVASAAALSPKKIARRQSQAIGHIVTCATARSRPDLAQQIVAAYAANGYIPLSGPVDWNDSANGWSAIEACIRNVSPGAAIALIHSGAEMSDIPAEPVYMNQHDKVGLLVGAGDISGLVRFLMISSERAEPILAAIRERQQLEMRQVIEARMNEAPPVAALLSQPGRSAGRRRPSL